VVEIARSWLASNGARPNQVHVHRRLRALEARRPHLTSPSPRRDVMVNGDGGKRATNDSGVLDRHIAGSVVVGRVTRVMQYGVWFNVEGIAGLLHVSKVPRRKADELERHYEVGQFHRVEILAIDRQRDRLELAHMGDENAAPE
jgi:hypothetical protein